MIVIYISRSSTLYGCIREWHNICLLPTNAESVLKILIPNFAPKGNQRRVAEEIVMAKFIDFLNCIEGTVLTNTCYYIKLTWQNIYSDRGDSGQSYFYWFTDFFSPTKRSVGWGKKGKTVHVCHG